MVHLEVWRLFGDIALLGALAYLCHQFVRSPRIGSASRQLRELETALRSLIKDADNSGRSLNDQLMRRQQSLEKLLIDAQLAEQRIHEATLAKPASATISAAPARDMEPRRRSMEIEREEIPSGPMVEPASFAQKTVAPIIDDSSEEESSITFGNTNIFGEPIATSTTTAPAAASQPAVGRAMKRALDTYSPLKAKIEKQVAPQPKASPTAGIEDVYAAAEELLRAGNDLGAVSSRTKLPIEEVRALSQMIIGERAVKTPTTPTVSVTDESDPRLGVLATMKRQTITL